MGKVCGKVANKKNSRIWNFLSAAKENLRDFNLFRKCGLLLWLVRAQHDHYESECARKSGGIDWPFHCESESNISLQIFIYSRFGADGSSEPKELHQYSTEGQKCHQSLAPVLAIISGNSLVVSSKIITSTGFYWCCASTRQHQQW